jgi:predicted nucleic acid-binding protein
VSAFIDTNILVRHLTGDPPEMAARATACLKAESELLLTDLVAAETVYVLESFYETPRNEVAEAVRSLVAFDAEGYLVACAESTGVGKIASFDPSLDGVGTIERVEPPQT